MATGTLTKTFTKRGASAIVGTGASSSWNTSVENFLNSGTTISNANKGGARVTCLYGLDFTSLQGLDDFAFTGITVTMQGGRAGTNSSFVDYTSLLFDFITDFGTTDSTAGVNLSNMTRITSSSITHASGNVAVYSKTYSSSDLGNTLTWMNNNKDKVFSGATDTTFGMRISNVYAKLESLSVTVSYTYGVSVTGVSLNKSSDTIKVSSTDTLTATINPSDADDKTVTWTSSNTSVATVSSSGVVTAVSPGTATITVKTNDGGYTATCKITVPVPVTEVSLNKTSTSIVKDTSETLIATVTPSNASDKSVTWSSSDASVISVSNGVVTGLKEGKATITVKTTDGGYTASCVVVVPVPVTGISLNKTSTTVKTNTPELLVPTIIPSEATNKNVIWASNDENIAIVSETGEITGLLPGTVTITATTEDGGYTATCVATISETSLHNIKTGIREIDKIYVGEDEIDRIYVDNKVIFRK